MATQTPQLHTQAPGVQDALRIRQPTPELDVVTVGFSGCLISSDRDAAKA